MVLGKLNYIRSHAPRSLRHLLGFGHRGDAVQNPARHVPSLPTDVIENHLVLLTEDGDTNVMTSYTTQQQL